MIGLTWCRKLDNATAWGFDVWEFSFRSLFYRYGRFFLTRIVLRHPLRTLRGLIHYRRQVRPNRTCHQAVVSWGQNIAAKYDKSNPRIIGAGFCQKPIEPPCPAGRFNHECLYLSQRNCADIAACRVCALKDLAAQAAQSGAGFYLMTSAEDIARDLLIPALKGSLGGPVLLLVCPYSLGPLSLAMAICGLPGVLLAYDRGDCRDYAAWIKADVGIKSEQTQLPDHNTKRIGELLTSPGNPASTLATIAFKRSGNIFLPLS